MEFLYSDTILAFLQKARERAKTILKDEVGLRVRGSRFFYNGYSYPLVILLFEDDRKLGYFDPNFYEIGLNKEVMLRDDLDDIIRHELAHYITWIIHGPVRDHGKEFHDICRQYGWNKEISLATSIAAPQQSRIASKIKKLLSLASSANRFEAEQATVKANELLMKHNIDHLSEESEMRVRRLITSKRASAKLQSIATILRTFLVYPVLNRGQESVSLEVFGVRENIEVAEYVAHFLDREFDSLWKESGLKGAASKNSFFRGIADGYCKRAPSQEHGLIKVENALMHALPMAYPHLSSKYTKYRHCKDGSRLGQMRGKSLTIKEGISSFDGDIKYLE